MAIRIAHHSLNNVSGMSNVARSIVAAEVSLGLDSTFVDCMSKDDAERVKDYDIHVVHTHVQDSILRSGKPLIWVAHGTPEVMFYTAFDAGLIDGSYGHSDAWMLAQYWLQHCDLTVTFWPRHQTIWKSLVDKRTRVECIPLGVDKSFWKPMPTQGKFDGSPSFFTAENGYKIKWPLDLFIAWPWVTKELNNARLHAIYVPKDQHRWWFPLVNRNGASFHSHISAMVFSPDQLRNAFCSTDFFLSLVRYGDTNRLCLEAAACGANVISYVGNPNADYWIHEGDQRGIAAELIEIGKGLRKPVPKTIPPDISETAAAMKAIYDSM